MKKINFKEISKRILFAVVAVIIASIIRMAFLSSLENKVVWITYYPAVMVAALLGGFYIGLLSAVFTCLIAIYAWPIFTTQPFINNTADWISLGVFLFNCTLVSIIAEYSRLQKAKADQAKEQAEFANRSKSTFLANMSHELRTPLNAILGFTRLMRMNPSIPEQEQRHLEIVNRSGEHLLNLINNVLDISKIESGKTSIDLTEFKLQNTLHDVILIMSQRAEAKELSLNTSLAQDLPRFIRTDELKLKQILINLLGNAIKFTDRGEVSLSISTIKDKKEMLLIEVKDTGTGISETDQAKIFDAFVQVGKASANKGTGLGLTICKQFSELLGGGISVKSQLGIGSTFQVRIPFQLADQTENRNECYQFVRSLAPSEPEYKILIVEDQIENWMLLQRALENIGFKTQVAENGAEGLEAFQRFSPDLIFMDVRMPVMDGLEATKKIRSHKNGKSVKIIGVSAHVFKDEVQTMRQYGMNDFIKKPYEINDIYSCLQQQLNVTYLYHIKPGWMQQEQNLLTAEMLNSIDPNSLLELKTNIERLDNPKLLLLAERIKEENKEVGEILEHYIINFRMTDIFRIINQIYTR